MQEPSAIALSRENLPQILKKLESFSHQCREKLESEGFSAEDIQVDTFLNLRYEGTDGSIMTRPNPTDPMDFEVPFTQQYQREYGFCLHGRRILVDDIRVRAMGGSDMQFEDGDDLYSDFTGGNGRDVAPIMKKMVWFKEGRLETSIFQLSNLQTNNVFSGPAIIVDQNSTVLGKFF